ncbi:MAG: alpha/beta fold hydrolase [Solirubrobacteraceae bacterium]
MSGQTPQAQRLSRIEAAFRSMPERYLGADPGFDATYHIRLGDVGHSWEVRATEHGVRVRKGLTRRKPDVTLSTDGETWLKLREGEMSGLEAYQQRLLAVRGNIDLSIGFEGLFRLPNGRPPLQRVHEVRVGRHCVSTLIMGSGPREVILLHGLGGTRASFFDTAAALSPSYRVHALDFPGFGSSSKPASGRYNARWFADIVRGYMDEQGIERAHVVGNSMGGRVAIELGLIAPERVSALGLLCPAVAFVDRTFHPIVRMLRPELGFLPHRIAKTMVRQQFWSLFSDRDLVDPSVADVVVDEFQRIYGSAGARYAFHSSARNIYLERPFGRGGFYPRLASLEPPALFVWTSHDKLIPSAFGKHVGEWLPSAEQVVIDSCGHVPQVERPEETNALLTRFFDKIDAQQSRGRRRPRVVAA